MYPNARELITMRYENGLVFKSSIDFRGGLNSFSEKLYALTRFIVSLSA